jgi:uncharacterized protein (DUF983 family)
MADNAAPFEIVWRALACKCPRCGKGAVYQGFLKFTEKCSSCELEIARHDNGDGPAVFLIFILGATLVPIALTIAMNTDWPLWVHGILWAAVVTVCTVGLLRPAKALTLGLQYRFKREAFDA